MIGDVRISDVCCCGGLGADGYAQVFGARAITGFDHEPQPDYPYAFRQADAMVLLDPTHPDYTPDLEPYHARHASFPCQALTTAAHLRDAQGGKSKYRSLGCDHATFPIDPVSGKPRPWGVWHVKGDNIPKGGHTAIDEEHGRHVMGSRRLLPWDTLKEGFPPAYTAWVGADLLVELARRGAVAA